jgi:hypothetical protein
MLGRIEHGPNIFVDSNLAMANLIGCKEFAHD